MLIFFTERALNSAWVDREIKHVLREEKGKGNTFELNKIISLFDSEDAYEKIRERYPELTDDLLHLMPKEYTKLQLGQLVSAIWSKYLSLRGGDVETQRQLLAKDREIFQRDQEIAGLKREIDEMKRDDPKKGQEEEFERYLASGKLNDFIASKGRALTEVDRPDMIPGADVAIAFGLAKKDNRGLFDITPKGQKFFEWFLLRKNENP